MTLPTGITQRYGHSAVVFGNEPDFRVVVLFGGIDSYFGTHAISETILLLLCKLSPVYAVGIIKIYLLPIPSYYRFHHATFKGVPVLSPFTLQYPEYGWCTEIEAIVTSIQGIDQLVDCLIPCWACWEPGVAGAQG